MFFGIARGTLQPEGGYNDEEVLVGRFPLARLYGKEAQSKHVPSYFDVDSVESILRSRGLPTELVIEIMDLAEYRAQSRLVLRDYPLHPSNGEELRKYLSYCWRLMVRCDELANACGRPIDWGNEVRDCIFSLFFDYPGYHPKTYVYVAGPNHRQFI